MYNGGMLLGQYTVIADSKNRIALPKRFRDELGDRIIITYGIEKYLFITKESEFETIWKDIEKESILLPEVRDLRRVVFGGASELVIDSKGRVLIPQYLKEYAEIGREVTCVGMMNYIEMWDSQILYNYRSMLTLTQKEMARKIGEKVREHAS